METKKQMCPFCPQFVEQDGWQPIGTDFFGEHAKVGDIASCAECATIAEITDSAEQMIATYNEMRQAYEQSKQTTEAK
jgi:hypothetical protein